MRKDFVPIFLKLVETSEGQPASPDMIRPDLAEALVMDAWRERASDIHLDPMDNGERVRFRIDGVLSDVAHLNHEPAKRVRNQFKAIAGLDPVTRFLPKDAHAKVSSKHHEISLRLALAPCLGGEALSVRLLDPKRLERPIKLHLQDKGQNSVLDDALAKVMDGTTSLAELREIGAGSGHRHVPRRQTRKRRNG